MLGRRNFFTWSVLFFIFIFLFGAPIHHSSSTGWLFGVVNEQNIANFCVLRRLWELGKNICQWPSPIARVGKYINRNDLRIFYRYVRPLNTAQTFHANNYSVYSRKKTPQTGPEQKPHSNTETTIALMFDLYSVVSIYWCQWRRSTTHFNKSNKNKKAKKTVETKKTKKAKTICHLCAARWECWWWEAMRLT